MGRTRLVTKRNVYTDTIEWIIENMDTFLQADTKTMDTLFSEKFHIGEMVSKSSDWSIGMAVHDGKLGIYLNLESFESENSQEFLCSYTIKLGSASENFQPLISTKIKHKFTEPGSIGSPSIITVKDLFSRRNEFFLSNEMQIVMSLTIFSDPLSTSFNAALQTAQKNALADSLANSFEKLLHSKQFTDVTVRCGSRNFAVHSLVLSARSSVFAKLFAAPPDVNGNNNNEIVVEKVSDEAMTALLQFMYTGRVQMPREISDFDALLYAAEKFNVVDLKTVCFVFMADGINDETAGLCALYSYKYKANYPERKIIVDYCQKQFALLMKKTEVRKMLFQTPEAFVLDEFDAI